MSNVKSGVQIYKKRADIGMPATKRAAHLLTREQRKNLVEAAGDFSPHKYVAIRNVLKTR